MVIVLEQGRVRYARGAVTVNRLAQTSLLGHFKLELGIRRQVFLQKAEFHLGGGLDLIAMLVSVRNIFLPIIVGSILLESRSVKRVLLEVERRLLVLKLMTLTPHLLLHLRLGVCVTPLNEVLVVSRHTFVRVESVNIARHWD